jgi:hypothetical protein
MNYSSIKRYYPFKNGALGELKRGKIGEVCGKILVEGYS